MHAAPPRVVGSRSCLLAWGSPRAGPSSLACLLTGLLVAARRLPRVCIAGALAGAQGELRGRVPAAAAGGGGVAGPRA
eukprot:scaffold3587_cov364-Prasinococcus_capsulatus_cf.AAC.14